jgi:hypothetical protein
MSLTRDPSLRALDDCGCCEGVGAETPAALGSRPGLEAIAYRVGTHATFKETLIAALSGGAGSVLRGLSAREQDFSIALLDAWAAVGDVLTFYQERIANEGYLRTAVERLSVLELARSIGYELRPGVAASTWLAFSLDRTPGAPERLSIGTGARVQSVPGPDERPQTFETVEAIEARPAWNALRPRLTRPMPAELGMRELYLEGVTTGLRPGDPILIVGRERRADAGSEVWDFRRLTEVVPDPLAGVTRVAWAKGLGWQRFGRTIRPASDGVRVHAFGRKSGVFGSTAPDWRTMPDSVKRSYLNLAPTASVPTGQADWPRFTLSGIRSAAGGPADTVYLDALYPGIVQGSWVVLSVVDYEELYEVVDVEEVALADFTLTSRVTRLTLRGENLDRFDGSVRSLMVFGESEPLALAEAPVLEPVAGDEVVLDGVVEGLEPGRTLLVRGRRARLRLAGGARRLSLLAHSGTALRPLAHREVLTALSVSDLPGSPPARRWRVRDETGVEGYVEARTGELLPEPAPEAEEVVAEAATLEEVGDDGLHTTLTLAAPLRNLYDRADARILANVAGATHGESVAEPLGSGDASRPYQRFPLRDGPLTYTPADTPAGGASTLEVRVNDLRWEEVPTLYGRDPRERVYVVRHGESGATVLFGDGRAGARPPTGRENVRAAYRKGTGREGNVRGGQLSLLMTRPLGVGGVTNPLPATGGTDPQQLADARDNAPLTVLTLDRLVSLRDYEDFARSFAGVAKALATWIWTGDGRGVFLTVAGPEGDEIPEGGPVQTRLLDAMRRAGDALIPVRVVSYEPARFHLSARVQRDPAHRAEAVHAAVETALRGRFSFARRAFGRAVTASEVIAVVQDVPGVVAVHLNTLHRADAAPALQPLLQARAPRAGEDASVVQPAQLLTLELGPDDIEVDP